MARIEVERTHQERPNTEANTPHDQGIRLLRIATVVVSIVNLAFIVATAVLVGILIGWYYSIHCFVLCLLILMSFVQTLRADTKIKIKNACWGSCTTLVVVLMTTFTLLTRQAYYHPSPLVEPKWVLFSLQASIIPVLVGILVMYECSIRGLYKDRFILMIAILDFADIWDMASILAQHKSPFLKEESPLEITVQFFCSLSFSMFSVLIYKNIAQSMLNNDDQPISEQSRVDQASVKKMLKPVYTGISKSNSQVVQNIPFLIIRVLLLVWYRFVDFDYLAKNGISVILWFLDCFQSCRRQDESGESNA